ncbi:MAG: tripartite tricarboxylate transporter TctB family protein [Pseudomonadota bacterium]
MMQHRASSPPVWARRLAAPLFLAALGLAMFMLARTQPAWLDERIGPGLFARWLSLSVVAMSLIWAIVDFRSEDGLEPAQSRAARPPLSMGLGLLAGVGLFALALPPLGLVIACALTAGVVGWAAGDRSPVGVGLAAATGGACALAVGLGLLPPGTLLWPQGL